MKTAVLLGLGLLLTVYPSKAIVSDSFENCEFLGNNRLKVSWTLRRSDNEIDFQLCGCTSSNDGTNEYMGFGLSGSTTATLMQGADPTITYVTDAGPVAVDYYLSDYLQCGEGVGACPDTLDSSGGCTDDVRNVTGIMREGLQCVSYTRSLASADTTCDSTFDPDIPQFVVWGVGGVGDTAFRHFRRGQVGDPPITFGRPPADMCSGGIICPNCSPFAETVIDVRGQDATFVANVGPPGNERGYTAIAGQAGWGFSWYINDTLIPRLVVERGYTYTFISEGGLEGDGNNYHPFYITNSRIGSWLTKSEAQRRVEVIYAGFEGETPIGVGPHCPMLVTPTSSAILNMCGSQSEYLSSLERGSCSSDTIAEGFTWTPDENTPNTVYYQCATHRNFGYQITVVPEIAMPTTVMTDARTEAATLGAAGVLACTTTIGLMSAAAFILGV